MSRTYKAALGPERSNAGKRPRRRPPVTATFEQLGTAIDDAFARWDHNHLHEFTLANGTVITPARWWDGEEPKGSLDGGSAEALAAILPQGTAARVPGNHMSAVAQPDLGAAIGDFLDEAPAVAS